MPELEGGYDRNRRRSNINLSELPSNIWAMKKGEKVRVTKNAYSLGEKAAKLAGMEGVISSHVHGIIVEFEDGEGGTFEYAFFKSDLTLMP